MSTPLHQTSRGSLTEAARFDKAPDTPESVIPLRSSGRSSALPARKRRVILYSHDTMGLGHIRRNLLLAQALTAVPFSADVLLITGARESGRFNLPTHADVVVLPALHKSTDGQYGARSLDLPLAALIAMRAEIVLATVKSYRPDLIIVDNVARGVNGELDPMLRYVRKDARIRCVLGLRDVRDEPAAVQREWQQQRCFETIRNFYHEVWVYGDSRVYDPRIEYAMPEDIAARIRFTGYLDQRLRLEAPGATSQPFDRPDKPFGLCMVGGGQDGAQLALAFAAAAPPPGTQMVLLTGPFMDAVTKNRLRVLAQGRPHLTLLEFLPEPTQLLREAKFVITMGGYNSVSEILSFEKRALVVPRVAPRREQLERAERLARLGVIDLLHPDDLSATALSAWLRASPTGAHVAARKVIDIGGLSRVPVLADDQLQQGAKPVPLHPTTASADAPRAAVS